MGQYVQDHEYFFATAYFTATFLGAALTFMLGLVLSHAVAR